MAYRANQKIVSFYVVALENLGIAEQDGRTDSSSTGRFRGNLVHQAFITRSVEEELQSHRT